MQKPKTRSRRVASMLGFAARDAFFRESVKTGGEHYRDSHRGCFTPYRRSHQSHLRISARRKSPECRKRLFDGRTRRSSTGSASEPCSGLFTCLVGAIDQGPGRTKSEEPKILRAEPRRETLQVLRARVKSRSANWPIKLRSRLNYSISVASAARQSAEGRR